MAKRPKTRIHHLADALDQLQKSQDSLLAIDLRACRADLRTQVKETREVVASAIDLAVACMKADAPEVPKAVKTPKVPARL